MNQKSISQNHLVSAALIIQYSHVLILYAQVFSFGSLRRTSPGLSDPVNQHQKKHALKKVAALRRTCLHRWPNPATTCRTGCKGTAVIDEKLNKLYRRCGLDTVSGCQPWLSENQLKLSRQTARETARGRRRMTCCMCDTKLNPSHCLSVG